MGEYYVAIDSQLNPGIGNCTKHLVRGLQKQVLEDDLMPSPIFRLERENSHKIALIFEAKPRSGHSRYSQFVSLCNVSDLANKYLNNSN